MHRYVDRWQWSETIMAASSGGKIDRILRYTITNGMVLPFACYEHDICCGMASDDLADINEPP